MIDLHLHTNFSPDSKQEMEKYFEISIEDAMVFTDHVDFSDISMGCDVSIDYKGYVNEINKLSRKYNKKSIIGVEVGYNKRSLEETNRYLENNKFDYIIMSIHQDETYNYLQTPSSFKVDQDKYLQFVLDGLHSIKNVNVIGHLDYAFRSNKYTDDFFNSNKLKEVFECVINNDIAIEVNTRSLFDYNNKLFYEKLLKEYLNCGGKLISIGSDGHTYKYYCYKFEEIMEFINNIGSFDILNQKL